MIAYRRDIDGLRCIAVMAVLLYHFDVSGVSGGYIGVDIFFVISGFLMGKLIIDEASAGKFSFIRFYERRIRRLYPAFVFVAVISAVAFYWILLPVDLRNFGKSLIGSVFYISNIVFYRETGYFDAGAVNKPLLHTWSLSVEEQFYIVFPLAALLLLKWGKRGLAILIAIIGLASLAASQAMLGYDQPASFFLFPFRAWELLIGVGAAMVRQDWLRPSAERLRHPLALAGMALMFAPMLLYDHDTPFPGVAALWPCLGTALVIVSGMGGTTATHRLLSVRPAVGVGLISYSLYLWHWPILVAINYVAVGIDSAWLTLGGIAASFVLAYFSWRFVEQPFRRRDGVSRRPLFVGAAAASIVLTAVGAVYYKSEGLPERFSAENQRIAIAAGDFLQQGGKCLPADNPVIPGLEHCRIGALDRSPDFLVWGDSHGRAYRDGLHLIAREQGRAGILVWGGGCPPLFGVRKIESAASPETDLYCYDQTLRLRRLLAEENTLATILLVGRWTYYTEGTGTGSGRDAVNRLVLATPDGEPSRTPATQQRLFEEALMSTVRWLAGTGRRVFILEQLPEIPDYNSRVLAQLVLTGRMTREQVIARDGVVPRDAVERRQAAARRALTRADSVPGVSVIPTHHLVCDARRCTSWRDGAPAYLDNNHLTVTASKALRQMFAPLFAADPPRAAE